MQIGGSRAASGTMRPGFPCRRPTGAWSEWCWVVIPIWEQAITGTTKGNGMHPLPLILDQSFYPRPLQPNQAGGKVVREWI